MSDFERNLEKYAEVIVKVGLNLQAGQRLIMGAPVFGIDGVPVEANQLIREVVKAAYQNGAKYVAVNWDDEELQRIRVQHGSLDSMGQTASWKTDVAIEYLDNGDALIMTIAQNPDLMGGLDPQKVQAKSAAEAEQFHKMFAKVASGATNWLAIGASITSWATKIFPDLSPEQAKTKLWDAIFKACRINHDDPVAEWVHHIAELARRRDYLNNKKYASLKYTAPGTNLTVGLPEGQIPLANSCWSQCSKSGNARLGSVHTKKPRS